MFVSSCLVEVVDVLVFPEQLFLEGHFPTLGPELELAFDFSPELSSSLNIINTDIGHIALYGQQCIYDDIPCVSTMYCKLLLWAGSLYQLF